MAAPTRPQGMLPWPGGSFRRYMSYCLVLALVVVGLVLVAAVYLPPISDGTFFFGGLIFTLGSSYAFSLGLLWWVGRRSRNGIERRLRRRPTRRHAVHVPNGSFTWNPSLPQGAKHGVYGPGEATYWLDDGNLVHLQFAPERGAPQEWVSETALAAAAVGPLAVRGLLLAYPLAAILGFVFGYLEGTDHSADRPRAGLWFALVAWFIAWLLVRIAIVVMRQRALNTKRGTVGSQ